MKTNPIINEMKGKHQPELKPKGVYQPTESMRKNKLSKKETDAEIAAINKILGSTYKKHDVKVPTKLDDPLLARRLYLKAAGRIPTHEELSSYLANSSKNKKTQLI